MGCLSLLQGPLPASTMGVLQMADFIDIPKNARETLRVQREEHQAHDLVNVRIWISDDSGELRPTKKGLAIQASLTPSLIEALNAMSAPNRSAA